MDNKVQMLWTSECNYEDWKDDLEELYPELSDIDRQYIMYDINTDYLNDLCDNLDIQLEGPILVIGDLGLWNGRVQGYKRLGNTLKDCFYTNEDGEIEWYVDEQGDLRATFYHHDGTNYYLYRAIKETATDEEIEDLEGKIYYQKATQADIYRTTQRLGDIIAQVYGWPIEYPAEQA